MRVHLLKDERQLQVTRKKLAQLEELYQSARNRPSNNAGTRDLTLRSIGMLIKQLKEEIAVYEAHHAVVH